MGFSNHIEYRNALEIWRTHTADGGCDITCPSCLGSGMDDRRFMCSHCYGVGLLCVAEPVKPAQTTRDTRRTRINIVKNTKGYSYETTVELTSSQDQAYSIAELADMLRDADRLARSEIIERERKDQEG